ncbi:MAG: HNH endonuclease [Moorea sp. SIO3I7]|uniref:HNH endonuclease n=1 Tax=Moorena TaxID=1155738 RepID=UPI0009D772CB|nr:MULTISPECIES: HNH endonuclease signature motif containing protein [Moorena]NEN98456.1 HNH endonuclease [Moorena sp. SIO3I7]NEO17614.1 HNH endonuclease [Moorena sp. SIO3E8]NEP27291.1 HNH endonuclease [Moorena sp. SIO3I6]NEQ04164.1 HNH endonuclease [Moorena sp. SIO3F7]NEQ62675.1 HNH endonuclease [Moorena sp. SIO4A1]
MRKRLKSVVVRLHYLRFRFRKCADCGLTFKDGDLLEIHHILPRANGGSNKDENLELLHLHCHDAKHGTKVNPNELDENPF